MGQDQKPKPTAARESFGALLRSHRKGKGISYRELEKLSGVSFSVIAAIERCERAAAGEIPLKLARALNLEGKEHNEFLFQALGTTRRERVPFDFRDYDPEVYRGLWEELYKYDLTPSVVKKVSHGHPENLDADSVLKAAAGLLAEQLTAKAKRLRQFAKAGNPNLLPDGLVLQLTNGGWALVNVTVASAHRKT